MEQMAAVSITATTSWKEDFRLWLASSARRGRGVKTIEAYESDIKRYSEWFESINEQSFEPSLLTSIDLRAYRIHSLETERVRPSTWNRRRTTLTVLCQFARETGRITYDPMYSVDRYEEEEMPPRWLTKADQMRLMRQLERDVNGAKSDFSRRQALRDQAMVVLMAYAGLREGELVALNLCDIELTPRRGKVVIRLGKGQKAGDIPLGAEARRAITAWLSVRGDGEGGDPVFNGKGTPRITTRQVQRVVSEIGRAAKLDGNITPHQFRHTFVKRAVDNGAPLTVVQKLARHKRIATTARYAKPGWSDLEEAVERL